MVEVIQLVNGLKLVFDKANDKHALINFSFNFGSAFEKKNHAGIAHFIEHLVFAGTENKTRIQINEELEAFGAKVNAYTNREFTHFYLESPAEYFEKPANLLVDCINAPNFPEKEIELERNIILNELKESLDHPQKLLFEKFYEKLFKSPIGRPIIGYENSIQSIKRNDFFKYFRKNYMASNAVAVVFGRVNRDNMISSLECLKKAKKPKTTRFKEEKFKPEIFEIEKNINQTHIVLGYQAAKANEDDYYALLLLNAILGSGLSSRLKKEIREKKGLAYHIDSGYDYGKNFGVFAIYAACKAANKGVVISLIKQELEKLTKKDIGKKELNTAKIKIESLLILGSSTPINYSEWLLESLNFNFGSTEKFLAKIKKLNSNDLRYAAKNYFDNTPLVVLLNPMEKIRRKKY